MKASTTSIRHLGLRFGFAATALLLAVCSFFFASYSGIVQAQTDPTITSSQAVVAAGQVVTVTWNGGSQASNCLMSFSDATRTRYSPYAAALQASVPVTIYSDTTFYLICPDNSTGAYLPEASTVVRVVNPAITTSDATALPGATITVSWDGGPSAGSCRLGLTDATRTNYAPYANAARGSGLITMYSDTTFNLVCGDNQTGAYLPQTSKTVSVITTPPTLAISDTTSIYGATITASWDGGHAASCNFIVNTPFRSGYQPLAPSRTGSTPITIFSDTTFELACTNVGGGTVPPISKTVKLVTCNPGYVLGSGICSPTATTTNILNELAALNTARNAIWNNIPSPWEVLWDGLGIPANSTMPTHQWWHVPFDDDWNEPRVRNESFMFDMPSPGFMTVDRTAAADVHKNGIILHYDQELNLSTGLTLELGVKLYPNSAENAFNIIYNMGTGPTLEVSLSPNKIVAGGYNEDRLNPTTVATAAFDTTQFHTYRFVQPANSNSVYLFVDGSPTPLLSAAGNDVKPNFLEDKTVPYISIGSEFGFRPAHYTLDFVRYRRGGYGPGSGSLPAPIVRPAPALPSFPPVSLSYTTILDGTNTPQQAGYTSFGNAAAWRAVGDGTLEYNSIATDDQSQLILDPPPGLPSNTGPYTLELRAKVLPQSMERGFGFVLLNAHTSLSLVLSPGKVETFMGLKPAGYQEHVMDTTDGFHTYRLVRPDRSLYGYLYVDDNPVPVIVDQPGSADGWANHPLFEMGTLQFADRLNSANLRGNVLIDYLRVSPTAYAPQLP